MNSLRLLFLSLLTIVVLGTASLSTASTPHHSLYLTFTENASTTVTLNWFHNADTPSGTVRYRVRGTREWRSQNIRVIDFPHSRRYIHRATLRSLRPGSVIEFQIPNSSKTYTVRMLPDTLNEPLRFAVGGDMMHEQKWLRETNITAARTSPYFVAIGGDLAYADGQREKVSRWYDYFKIWYETMVTPEGHIIPMIPGIGNHEVKTSYSTDNTDATFFFHLFDIPDNRAYYRVDAGNYLSMIMLDTDHTNAIVGAQTEWLKNTLEEVGDRPHVYPVFHVPAYPSVRDPESARNVRIRSNWVPLFEEHGVRIVFEKHDHTYKRTIPLKQGRADADGITYIGDGSWGVHVRMPANYWYLDNASGVRHFIDVRIHQSGVTTRAIRENGILLDQFTNNFNGEMLQADTHIPGVTRLYQNYPNPFNPSTTISFSLAQRKMVELNIYTLSGQRIRTLVSGTLDAGNHSYLFHPQGLSTGTYFARLITENSTQQIRIMYVK